MAKTALDLYVAAVASKKNGEFINTEKLKGAYIGVIDAMAKEIERDGSSLLLNLFAARWYRGYPNSDVYIANLTKIELDTNFGKHLNSWRSPNDYKNQYSAKFKCIDTSDIVAILEGVRVFFYNSSDKGDKNAILGRYSEHFKTDLFNRHNSVMKMTLLPKKLENSTKRYTASAFAELIRAIDAALVKKQGSQVNTEAVLKTRRIKEAEARKQAELKVAEEEIKKILLQTKLKEAEAKAELKAAEEERKRILLQAKLKEAEAKAKQEEKARKAEFEARRVQEAEARRQAELRATQEAENKRQAELEARRVQEAEARRQAELRATQEAEARKQAELKAADEERKRILLQAKLKEAEAKAKQDEKARKAEFEARRVQEAEARRQAELRATQEAEARRQTELRAVQEAEARKQAELKAAEEERKRILLQAKLKEAEAKAKQEEKARKAEFETKRVQETEARRQAELIAIQEAELEARRIQEAEAKRQAELEIRRVQESNAIRQSELIAAQKAVAKRQAALEARRAQAEREKKSFLMEELMLENNIREDDERWKTIRQFLKVAKNIHEIAQEFVGKPVKVKKRFINNNKVIKDSLEFAELQRIDKRIIQIRNLIPQGEAINNEYAKKFVDAFEELLETITSNLKDRLGVERIPWPSTGKCSQDLLNEGYEKYNTESRFAKSTNDYDKIYEELRVGIRIDDEIVQAPFFNVYE